MMGFHHKAMLAIIASICERHYFKAIDFPLSHLIPRMGFLGPLWTKAIGCDGMDLYAHTGETHRSSQYADKRHDGMTA